MRVKHGRGQQVSGNKEEDAITRHLGSSTQLINFPQTPDHAEEVGAMAQMTRGQDVANFNRPRNDLTRSGKSRFRGVASMTALANGKLGVHRKGYQAITNYDIRYYDVEAMINGNTPRLSQMEVETTCPVTAPAQAYPHGMNTNDDGYSNNIQPTIYHARGFCPAKGGLPNFVEILGLVKQDNGLGLRFQHGDFSPFDIYRKQNIRKPAVRHTAAIAFQSYEQTEIIGDHQYSSFAPQTAQNAWSLPPYSFNFESEQRLNTVGLGFKHSSTSRFKVYKRNTMWKGKAKVNF
ncbi:hypothetical protein NC653_015749 [Populus alba x Populus x berolinensis]|uniref:Uncharacterized protein n=1 Tax=Populus alba x Populus x berolinensis TaxID=444605 RepID=A0AAD6QL78_9ROSI|nr:hypothetical protein NC653_015749 [Populus alba x Populus x berolinensis]